MRILILRLGSLGDVIHTLPAAATLKRGVPGARVCWLVSRRWLPLLLENALIDELLVWDGSSPRDLWKLVRQLRQGCFDIAVDFQGLIKSAVLGWLARPGRLYGFDQAGVREKPAALFYSQRVSATAAHVVEKNLELALAAGAKQPLRVFPLPMGRREGELPDGPFVLASPLAGWAGKQWPLEYYGVLAGLLRDTLGIPLVLCGPPWKRPVLEGVQGVKVLLTGLEGLVYATRRATAVVGIDSGPLHLAAALGKPGVAIFGPTDPARNGPYGGSFTVLRDAGARTTYKRRRAVAASMRAIRPQAVLEALIERLAGSGDPLGFDTGHRVWLNSD